MFETNFRVRVYAHQIIRTFVPKRGKCFGFFAETLGFSEVSNIRMVVSLEISHTATQVT